MAIRAGRPVWGLLRVGSETDLGRGRGGSLAEMEKREVAPGGPDEAAAPETPADRGGAKVDLALTIGLVVYVLLLGIATIAEVFEIDSILRWFR